MPPDLPLFPKLPSPDEIEAAKTAAGGWTKATLAQWGVPWPPPKGWRSELIRKWKWTGEGEPHA